MYIITNHTYHPRQNHRKGKKMKKVALYVRVSTKDQNPARGAIAE